MHSSQQTKISAIVETTIDYSGSFVYEEGSLKYILAPEGRVMKKPDGTFSYQYFLKVGAQRKSRHCGNHLGNTRVTFDQTGTVIQEDSYYPFGMAMSGLSYQSGTDYPNKYLYNGKELQDDFGLEWYDYGTRFYDPALGSWTTIDPKAELNRRWSPYRYAYDNPLRFLDPDGMFEDDFYFRQDGTLVNYVENDEPDRVFVATGETTTDENSENPMPEPVYEQVEMSSKEVEQKMGDNGYKKVVKEEIVVQDETHLFSIEPNGETDTKTISLVETREQKNKYVEKETNLTKINSKHLETIDSKRTTSHIVERNLVKKTYKYGGKKDNNQRNSEVMQLVLKIINAFQ